MKKYLNLLLFVCFVCVATFANAQSRNDVTITTSVYPELAGTTSGDGNYSTGENVTVIAFSSVGWKFDKWTIDGTEVSTMTEFEFLANENLSLTAHFIETEIPPAFTNEFHDLNDNQIPENWELEIKWGNVQIAEGKIMAYKVDAFGGLARKGHLTENVSKIICEWDGNIEPTNSGMAPHIYIDFNDDHFFRLYHQIESWDSTKTFFRYYNGSGQQQIIFENFEAKNIGEHHYQLTIENNEIVYKGWFKNTQELIFEKYIDPATVSSAFSLIHIDKIRFFANSTTSNNNWEDNLSIQVYSNIIDGLMAHYPFNGNANDESGNGHDGINYGATLTNDRFGNESSAYNFDGVDDYMNMGTNINPGKTATFAFWIHPENNNTDQSVISKWTGDYSPPNPPGGTNRKRNYSILINQGQDLNGAFSETNNVPGTQSIVTSIFSDPIDYERWQFFVISVDTDTTKLYHNGILQNEVETTIDSIAESTIPTIIGNNNYLNNNFNGGAFKGMIDDIRVFDRVINESQILQLYQEGGWPLLKADFSASPRQGTAPLTVQFTDESTGNPTSWAWDFDNDGNIDSEEADPIWVYNDPGQYTVCLTISDGTETTTHCDENFIIVTPEYIPVECNELIITNEKYNETENLISKVQDEYGMDYTIADWTDLQAIEDIQSWISCIGIPENQTFMCTRNGDYFYGSSRQYYVHYSSDGNPYPGFLVHDQLGDLYLGSWYGLNMNILAKNTSGFIADFSASPRQGTAPLTVQFTDESIGNPTSWVWDFDNDGNIDSEEADPIWVYNDPGQYTVCLTISDGTETTTHCDENFIIVTPEYIPVECNELIITNEKYNETENLISKVQDEYGMDYTIADWTDLQAIEDIQSWISCIGIPENQTFMCTRNGDYFYGSSRQYYVHYSSDGNPYPGFLVHDQLGDLYLGSWYGLNMNILAKNTSGFIADFSASPRQGTAPLTVQFTDESTGNPTSWAWDFDNDGNIDSEEQHPEYIYFTQGNYTVSLTVSDGIHTDSKSIDDYILVSEDLQLPTVVTVEPANISQTSAQSGGNVTDDGGAEVTARGICWNTSGTPTIGDNITSDGFGTGAFNSSIIGLSCNTTYFLRGYATNSVGTSYGEEFEFSTLPCNAGPYFETIWTTPFSPMNIYVTKATIDEFNMVAGDEIGLFDVEPGSGNEICVGAAVLTEELIDGAYLLIIASMDDGTGDANGFQAGNEIIYKMYSQIEGLVELLTVTYPYPGYDEVFTALGSATVELEGITVISQTLDFVEGWNLTSMRTIADNLDMLSVFNPLIEDEQLLKVINQDGFSVEHLPFPPPAGQWANSIGNWVMEQGYYVKVNENTSLNITAPPVETPMELPLRFGWNMIGMPCELPQSAQTMLQPLIDDGVILKVLNEQGQAIEHLPFPPPSGQWVFGFSSFNPGEGYYVKAAEESQIYFDCNAEYQDDKGSSFATTNFFVPVYQNNPYMPMNVVLNGIESLNAGDEIGIFDNDRCVGAGVIGQSEFVSIPVSMDDPATDEMDGFVTGNSISVKVWQKDINNLVETNLLHLSGALVFTALETYAGMLDFTTTQLFETSQVEFNISVAPNPFSNHTWVYYSLPEIGSLVFKVFNINGILETTVEVDNHPKTSGRVKFDRNQLQPGSYILQCTFSAKGHTEFVNHKLFIK
jgi:PKD repeat protein